MSKFEIHVSKEIEESVSTELLKALTSAFINYKTKSEKYEHPVASRERQETFVSAEKQFGRDRFEKLDKDKPLQHVHLNDGNRKWEDEEGYPLAQWHCTSDTQLIYSYFKINSTYHYYLMEIYTKDAHKAYVQTKTKLYERAKAFEEQKLKEYDEEQDKSA